MKRFLSLLLRAFLVLGMLCSCKSQPTTPPETTEAIPTQSPEEAAVFKVLMIGQSHAQDSIWFLCDVLKAEMPDKEFLVADIYQPIAINEHIQNIKNDASVYDYIVIQDGKANKIENYRISIALKQEHWDLVIFNEATWPQIQEINHTDGDIQFLTDYIRQNVSPDCKLAYNATWSHPVSKVVYGEGRADAPDGFRSKYERLFGGDKLKHFERLCQIINTYVETDPDYDFVFHSGTAIQYAAETHGVPDGDPERKYEVYRDYTHLSDFGRLIVAYQIYAQIYGLTELNEVNVDVIPADMRATFREQPLGDIEITQAHKQAIIASVNYALAHPNEAPPQEARQAAILEPLT